MNATERIDTNTIATKPRTWFLEMKVGTVFAFSINTDDTLQLANGSDDGSLSDAGSFLPSSSSPSSSKLMIGYVRHVCPEGLDIGLLASNSTSSRKGLSIQTPLPAKSKSGLGRQSIRSQLFSSPSAVFGANTTLSAGPSSLLSLGPKAPGSPSSNCLISTLSAQAPPLAVSGSLPRSWGSSVAAFHPNVNRSQDTSSVHRAWHHSHASDLRTPCGHGHKHRHTFVLGGYDTTGKRCGDIQPRLAREEIVRAEKIMSGIRHDEEEALEAWLKRSLRQNGVAGSWAEKRFMKTPTTSLASVSSSSSGSSGSDCDSLSVESSVSSRTSETSSSGSRCSEQLKPTPIVIDAIFDLNFAAEKLMTIEECDEEFAKIDELLYWT